MMAGRAVTVTLLPEPDDRFTVLCANVEMLDVPVDNTFSGTVNGWFRPGMPVEDFLAAYSENGGIHHFSVAYGADVNVIRMFAKFMGWGFKQLC
jgi:L-arabinose isomerase